MDPIDQNEIDSRKVDLDLKKKKKGITKVVIHYRFSKQKFSNWKKRKRNKDYNQTAWIK